MTGFLLDTNAISIFSPTRAVQNPGFAGWLEEQEKHQRIYLSCITVHEIEKGAGLLRAKGATSKAALIDIFLQGLVAGYADRILDVDAETARESGRMEAKAIAAGHSPGVADAIIAGTASHHGLTVITRNLRHFQPFGISVKSPEELS